VALVDGGIARRRLLSRTIGALPVVGRQPRRVEVPVLLS
jgi:hypothetical protein